MGVRGCLSNCLWTKALVFIGIWHITTKKVLGFVYIQLNRLQYSNCTWNYIQYSQDILQIIQVRRNLTNSVKFGPPRRNMICFVPTYWLIFQCNQVLFFPKNGHNGIIFKTMVFLLSKFYRKVCKTLLLNQNMGQVGKAVAGCHAEQYRARERQHQSASTLCVAPVEQTGRSFNQIWC